MAEWQTLRDPGLTGVVLKYPLSDPSGEAVEITRLEDQDSFRIRLTSGLAGGVYFELGRYPDLAIDEAMDAFIMEVGRRGGVVRLGELEEVQFFGFPAYRFTLKWSDKERTVLFFEARGDLFRIIYNTESPINKDILASLRFNDDPQA